MNEIFPFLTSDFKFESLRIKKIIKNSLLELIHSKNDPNLVEFQY